MLYLKSYDLSMLYVRLFYIAVVLGLSYLAVPYCPVIERVFSGSILCTFFSEAYF